MTYDRFGSRPVVPRLLMSSPAMRDDGLHGRPAPITMRVATYLMEYAVSKEGVQIAILEQKVAAMEERINVLTSETYASKVLLEAILPVLAAQSLPTRDSLLNLMLACENGLHAKIALWTQSGHDTALHRAVEKLREARERLATAFPRDSERYRR